MQISNHARYTAKERAGKSHTHPFFDSVRAFLERHYISVLSLLWLSEKLLNYKLWVAHSNFPTAPVADFLLALPPQLHNALFCLSVGIMGCLVVQPKLKWAIPALLIIELCACILDQLCWSPWEYEFIFTMAILALSKDKPAILRAGILFMLAGTYFYSGVHKFNQNFLYFNYTGILHTIFKVPVRVIHQPYIYRAGYLLALFEALLGLGLLFTGTQKRSAQLLIVMHLLIAGSILVNPGLYKYNLPIVPWNITNVFLLYVFFVLQSSGAVSREWLTRGVNPLVILCFGILPIFSFWDLWENDLSLKFYSGKFPPKLVICITDTATTPDMRPFYSADELNVCKGETYVFVNDWAVEANNVRPYPEKRISRVIKQYFIERHPNTHCRFLLVTQSRPPQKPPLPF